MKILYKQPDEARDAPLLSAFGVRNCYCKQLSTEKDVGRTLHAEHFHTDYEIHLVLQGKQRYQTETGVFSIEGGWFLLIPPRHRHAILWEDTDAIRYAFTFSLSENSPLSFGSACALKPFPIEMTALFFSIADERKKGLPLSEALIEGRVLECLLLLARKIGLMKGKGECPSPLTDARVSMALQFIEDNILSSPTIADVAAYCHMSTKQLARLFTDCELPPIATYVRERKIAHLQRLLADSSLSLRQISDKMGFSSEYAFHAFFKKYCGMPPGKYRKMIK